MMIFNRCFDCQGETHPLYNFSKGGGVPVYKQIEEVSGKSWDFIKKTDPDYDGTYEGNLRLLEKYKQKRSEKEYYDLVPNTSNVDVGSIPVPHRRGMGLTIYKDVDDYADVNKLEDKVFKGGSQFFKGGNSCWINYNGEIECKQRSDDFINRVTYPKHVNNVISPNEFRKALNAEYSVNRPPTEEERLKYPYFKDDYKFGSLDARDVYGQAMKHARDRVVMPLGRLGDVLKYGSRSNKIAVGDYVLQGNHSVDDGFYGISHVANVVGYNQWGEPIINDYGNLGMYPMYNYFSNGAIIGGHRGDRENALTYDKAVAPIERYNRKNDTPYVKDLNKIPLHDGKFYKASKDFKKYHNTLVEDKYKIMEVLGIPEERYDELAKSVIAIAGNETKYGNSGIYKWLDDIKRSKGVAQLRLENLNTERLRDAALIDDEQWNKILKESKEDDAAKLLAKVFSPETAGKKTVNDRSYAIAAIAYADALSKDLENNRQDVVDARRKAEIEYDEDGNPMTVIDPANYVVHKMGKKSADLKSVARRARSGKFGDLFGNEVYEDGNLFNRNRVTLNGKTVKLPRRYRFDSDEEYDVAVNALLKEQFPELNLSHRTKGDSRSILRETRGNTIPNTVTDNIGYGWKAPSTLRMGDAQGDDVYYKNYKANHKLLFGR